MPLTDLEIKKAKPKEKPYNLPDGKGMYLKIMPTGGKLWRLAYRFSGKQKTLYLGEYPDLTLTEARKKQAEARELLAQGIDPAASKQETKHAAKIAASSTFESVALEWHKKQSFDWSTSHAENIKRRMENYVFPIIGNRSVKSLKTSDLLEPLRIVEERNHLDVAQRLRQYITSIMRYAVQTGRIDSNTAADLQGAIATRKHIHRPTLPLERLPELLRRIDEYKGMRVIQCALLFALLTGARSSEFRFARWKEFDLDIAVWTIPPEREAVDGVKHSHRGEKMKSPRIIYLARQAVELLRSIRPLTGNAEFVFEGVKRGTPISDGTPNKALRDMGFDTKAEQCLHGFRTLLVSSLNESGLWSIDAVERHVGHEERSETRAAYMHKAQFLKERQQMMQWWADHLDKLKAGAEIIQFKRA